MELIPAAVAQKFQIAERHHAASILAVDFPDEWADLTGMLAQFTLRRSQIMQRGGRKSAISLSIDDYFINEAGRSTSSKLKWQQTV